MAFLNRDQIKLVVIKSLKVVADIPGDLEEVTFTSFNDDQKHFFLSALKKNLNELPYIMKSGATTSGAYYDIDLMPDSTDDWPSVGNCIDWIEENQKVVYQ